MKRYILLGALLLPVLGCESFFSMSNTSAPDAAINVQQDAGDAGIVDQTGPGSDIFVRPDIYIPPVKTILEGRLDVPNSLKSGWRNMRVLLITDLTTAGSHILQMVTPTKDGVFKFVNFKPGTYYLYAFHFTKQGLSVLPDAIGVIGGDPGHPKTVKVPANNPIVKDVVIKLTPQYIPYGNGSITGHVTLDDKAFDPMDAVLFLGDNPEIGKCHWYTMTILNSDLNLTIKGLSPATYYLKAYLVQGGDITKPIGYGYYNDGFFPKGIVISKDQPNASNVDFHIYDYFQSPALVSGKVTGANGGVTYVVFLRQPFPVKGIAPRDYIQPDQDGKYLETTLPYDNYYVYAYHFKDQASVCPDCYDASGFYSGGGHYPKAVVLSKKHQVVGDIDINLVPFKKGKGVICGRVQYSQGMDPNMTRVFCTLGPSLGPGETPIRWATVDKSGYFCVKNLPLDQSIYVHASLVKDFQTMDVSAQGTYMGDAHVPVPVVLTEHRVEFDGAFIQMMPVTHTPYTLDVTLNVAHNSKLKPSQTAICLTPYPYLDLSKCTAVGVPDANWHVKMPDMPKNGLYVFAVTNCDPQTGACQAMGYYSDTKNSTGLPAKVNLVTSPTINFALKDVPAGDCSIQGTVQGLDPDMYLSTSVFITQNGPQGIGNIDPVMITGVDSKGNFKVNGLSCEYFMPTVMAFNSGDTGNLPSMVGMPLSGGIPVALDISSGGVVQVQTRKVDYGGGTVIVSIQDFDQWKGHNIVLALYSDAPQWGTNPYPLVQTPDATGHVAFNNVPYGKWFVYAFAYNGPVQGQGFDAIGVSSVDTIPVPIELKSGHKLVNLEMHIHTALHGEGVITGHVTNIGSSIHYADEAVFLCTNALQHGDDPKGKAILAVAIQDDGNYIIKNLPNGRYYVYAAHYPNGNFKGTPDAVGFYTMGTQPVPVSINPQTGQGIQSGIDLVLRQGVQ